MMEKIARHLRAGTLKYALTHLTLKYIGYFHALRLIRKVLSKKRALWDVPRSACDLELPNLQGPCVVFGSSPSAVIPNGYNDDWSLITAGSAQHITDNFGLKKPDMSVMVATSFLHGNSSWEIMYNEASLNALIGKTTGYLIMQEDKFCSEKRRRVQNELILKALKRIDFNFDRIKFVPFAYHYKLPADVLGDLKFYNCYSLTVSSGLFAALIAYLGGASPIILTGFSFSHNKHAYPDDYFNKPGGRGDQGRGELAGDRAAIEIILKNGWPFYAAEELFSVESGLKLWSP